jgi:hypothetical protein
MGLLQKANEKNDYSIENREEDFKSLYKRLDEYKNHIEFYPMMFRELVNLFSIEKGSLLIKEGTKYNLTSLIGYDETTKNRLRFQEDELERLLKTKEVKDIKKYFSIREAVTLDSIDTLTLRKGDDIVGVILVSQFKLLNPPDIAELQGYCNRLEDLISDNPLQRLREGSELTLEVKEKIVAYSQSVKNADNRILFIKMNTSDIIEKLNDSMTTPSSIGSNINKLLNSFIGDRGRVYQINSREIILAILDKNNNINISIIQQQILSALKSIFSRDLGSVDMGFETLIWKDKALDIIIEHLIE